MKGFFSTLIILFFLPTLSFAQKAGQVGFNFEIDGLSSPTIGVTFHITDRMTIRPTLEFSKSNRELEAFDFSTQQYVIYERKSISYGGGLGILFYLVRKGDLHTYSGVETSLYKTEIDVSNQPPGFDSLLNSGDTTGRSINGLFGLHYMLNEHIGITGEIGLGYTIEKTEGHTEEKLSTTSIGLASTGIGVIIYMN